MKTRSSIGVLMHARSLQFDVGVQRYMSLKATQHEFFRPTTKNTILGALLFVIPYFGLTYIIKRERVCTLVIRIRDWAHTDLPRCLIRRGDGFMTPLETSFKIKKKKNTKNSKKYTKCYD